MGATFFEQLLAAAAWHVLWNGEGDYLNDREHAACKAVASLIPFPFK